MKEIRKKQSESKSKICADEDSWRSITAAKSQEKWILNEINKTK